ncbi:rRNA maturation RNase YbeY [Primorskyibacter sp. S187A]|uniref:rRNA maturation RNase YbeY n=1 Tax=Primorskyibacter sp. S187A TaxID=3415130 RepID=UPI003C7D1922
MLTDTVIEDPRWEAAGLADLAERAARASLSFLQVDTQAREIAVLGCDDARIAALNADFRNKPSATNVLSWPAEELACATAGGAPAMPRMDELGDIAIAYETCAREAEAAGKPLAAHATHLLVHATLHLLGYDHVEEADAALMEELESQILTRMGEPDPYA